MTFQIIHVIPSEWGPFVDIRACYESLARRRPTTTVISSRELEALMAGPLWRDERVLVVLWELFDPGPKYLRRCKIAHVYAEAMDEDLDSLLPQHRAHWDRFKTMTVHFDCVFAHTPWAADLIQRQCEVRTFTMPAGWDPTAMGSPRWLAPKHQTVGYHGSVCGRRDVYVPYFAKELGLAWVEQTGRFGRGLLGALDTTRLSFYIAHSCVTSFSTWRLWQLASTSCALVIEGAPDAWPADKDCYLSVPFIRPENAKWIASEILDISRRDDACRRAAAAMHEVAQKYTVDYIEDTFVIPAMEMMLS